MSKSELIRRITLILLLASMLFTLAFIFSNSMKTPEESLEQSDTVGDIVAEIIPPETPSGAFVQENLRKIAHFTEFAILGAEMALAVILCLHNRLIMAIFTMPAAFLIALIDEGIQHFSGRGPSIVDACIDLAGFASASLLFYGAAYLVLIIIRSKNNNLEN